jgi:hypothetical protein
VKSLSELGLGVNTPDCPKSTIKKGKPQLFMSLRDTVNHEKLLYPCWSTAESRLFGAEHTENFSVISRNYSMKQNTSLSPKECTEYKCELSISFLKLMASLCSLWFGGGSRLPLAEGKQAPQFLYHLILSPCPLWFDLEKSKRRKGRKGIDPLCR